MIKDVLSVLNYKEVKACKYYYHFQHNLTDYIIYRDNQYKLFNLSLWVHQDPFDLISEFYIDEEPLRDKIKELNYSGKLLSNLIDAPFSKVLGQYLQLKHINNSSFVENISQDDLDYFSSLEYLSERFFVTKYGLTMFSEQNQGIIYFNEFNCIEIGKPFVFLPRKSQNTIDTKKEEVLIFFSPYTIREAFSTGKSHFKDNLLFISNTQSIDLEIALPSFNTTIIHIRPTKQELLNYLLYATDLLRKRGKRCNISYNDQTLISFTTISNNYAKLRGLWINKLNNEVALLTGLNSMNSFRLKCLSKNNGYDTVQFTFKASPSNMIIFVQSFLFNYFNDDKISLKDITRIHYDKGLPSIIEIDSIPKSFEEDLNEITEDEYSDEFYN